MRQETPLQKIFTSAHNDYDKSLKKYAFFKMHNRLTSEDLVQNAFIKTWKYLVKGGKIKIMKAFLYHVLNGLIIDEYRKGNNYQKHRITSIDLLAKNGLEPQSKESDHFFDILDGKTAFLLIKRLPKKYQKLMNMRYFKDLSLEEMSCATKKTKNSIAVLLHRGLKKLRLLYMTA